MCLWSLYTICANLCVGSSAAAAAAETAGY